MPDSSIPTPWELDNGDRVVADKIVIATGSRPVVPEAWQAFGDKVITTDSFFEQEDLPESLAVVGLGVIGLELGQSLARLDVKGDRLRRGLRASAAPPIPRW